MQISLLNDEVGYFRTSAAIRCHVVEGYAIATCLVEQSEPYLKDQGDAGRRSSFNGPTARSSCFARCRRRSNQRSRRESRQPFVRKVIRSISKPVPVLYCAEIIDEAPVRAAIDGAIKKLTPAYRRAQKSR